MNLYNLGRSGIEAALAGLATTDHNINNAVTVGYSRQKAMLATAGATATPQGFFGRGVEVETVARQTNNFVYHQWVSAEGEAAQQATRYEQLSTIANFFSDNTIGIAPALSNFFASVNAAASKPADMVTRQDFINQGRALVTQIQTADRQLQDQRAQVNSQVRTIVDQINSYLVSINDLNQKIGATRGAEAHTPNDLLDQRDQVVAELNKLVGINFYEQGDNINVMLSGGQTLLSGKTVYPLSAVQSAEDPARIVVAYSLPAGLGVTRPIELDDEEVTGGKLGGLLEFRVKSLNPVQDRLGQLAVGLSLSFNAQHTQGRDFAGIAGGDFFAVTAPAAIPNAGNGGVATLQSSYVDATLMQASPYKILFDGLNYVVTRVSDNTQVYNNPAIPLVFDGLSVNVAGAANAGDTWLLQATRDAAGQLNQLITDPTRIALSNNVLPGTANGENGLLLARLQTVPVFGNLSLNGKVSQLVHYVGVETAQVKTATMVQNNLVKQTYTAMQSVSGVNLNEEYVNLTVYQDQYRASARMIDVASIIFDTLLSLRV